MFNSCLWYVMYSILFFQEFTIVLQIIFIYLIVVWIDSYVKKIFVLNVLCQNSETRWCKRDAETCVQLDIVAPDDHKMAFCTWIQYLF